MKRRMFTVLIVVFVLIGFAGAGAVWASDSTSVRHDLRNVLSKTHYASLTLSVENDTVTITGSVSTYWDKCKVHDLIQTVPGVRVIRNYLIVKTPFRFDGAIRNSILCDIEKKALFLHPKNIQVHVTNGLVILTGSVSSDEENRLAFSIAAWQKGVHSVINQLQIEYPVLSDFKESF
ncbi:MAG: BON domain-containing protein [Calditrichaeota bacterium]|nr:BON domain-containing protein [Calditrichota bacterium]